MRVLVTGASGQLGAYVIDELTRASLDVAAWSGSRTGNQGGVLLQPVNLNDVDHVATAFLGLRPSIVIHAAALSSAAQCFRDPQRATSVNVQGTALLAELSGRVSARFVYVSTDLVFDGQTGSYRESDLPSPLSVYGRTKAQAERLVLEIPSAMVARLSLMYGPTRTGRPAFFDHQLAAIRNRRPLRLFEDEWRSPLDLTSAARALVCVAQSDYSGLLHVGGPNRMSRLEMGQRIAACLGYDPGSIIAATRSSSAFAEPRPRDCSLDSSRWRALFPDHPWPVLEQATAMMISGGT
jgi:dTDP-4-dehydrorhamnose reductase